MSAQDPIEDAFEAARQNFLRSLKGRDVYNFSQFTSINHVYDTTDKIQEEQGKSGALRSLNRIRPYLDCLSQYVGVIDTLIQAKPDILCLIWGPIKLFLQISSTLIKSFDRVVEVLAEVGQCLPQFQKYAELFKANLHIKQVLCLFYTDILDFHATVLKFFGRNKWKIFFESMWPRCANKISVIQSNIVRHKSLMDSEVTLESVVQAYEAREKAYQEYERTHQFQDWQNFEAVRAAISPYLYDNDLETFRRECKVESGQWLEEEDNFKKWSDPDDHSVRLFWLQGIPGAGKTVMSSVIICHKRAAGYNVLFAFPRHNKPTCSSALKILHSLIFQVLLDNQPLQPVMHEAYTSNYRQIMSSLEFTTELFVGMVNEVGPVFIVVDGVDEMAELERRLLLKTLTGQLQACKDLKLLVSSRGERDIALILGNDVPSARVDHKNITDIEACIEKQTNDWLPELESYGADDSMCSEAKLLLKSISKAKGMFLYVKLVMRNVTSQDNLYDIRNEIDNLPDGLDQAYARILARIEQNLDSKECLMVRKIMEWIGCANFSLTVGELLQALAITPGQKFFLKGRKAFRAILRLCGPIIEIENNVVQFVHFTAKEYVFGKQSNEFLNSVDGNLGIASVCLSYLSFECFDDVLSTEDIGSNILSGDYVLFMYAADEWLEHIRQCARHLAREPPQSLRNILSTFAEARENFFFQAVTNGHHVAKDEFQSFQAWPNLYEMLIHMDSFMWKQRSDFLEQNDSSWVDQDPSTISSTKLRIRRQLEAMLCPSLIHIPSCPCHKLRSLYGRGLFKCDRFRCQYYRVGFDTCSDRDSHLRIHNRPFKCPEPNCEFSDIGFISEKDLSLHGSKTHEYHLSNMKDTASEIPADQFLPEDLISILKDVIEADEVEFVRNQYARAKVLGSWHQSRFVTHAAKTASPIMVDLLLEEYASIHPNHTRIKKSALSAAIQGENMVVIKHLITRGAEVNLNGERVIEDALETYNPEIVELLLGHGAHLVEHPHMFYEILKDGEKSVDEVFNVLYRMHKYVVGKEAFSYGLSYATRRGSIPLVKYFIDNGADVNPNGERVIEDALETYNPEIVELLLGYGAHLVELPHFFCRILGANEKTEDEIFNVLHRMHKYVIGKKAFSHGLSYAIWRGSIPLANYFIDNGADVNSSSVDHPSLLYALVRRYSRRHVEGIKFLLHQGADPYPLNSKRQSIKSLTGMQKVEQYFDKGWDDLVKEAQAERASTTNEG